MDQPLLLDTLAPVKGSFVETLPCYIESTYHRYDDLLFICNTASGKDTLVARGANQATSSDWADYFQSLLKVKDVQATRFARDTGMAPSTPGTWVNGGIIPQPSQARKVAEYFNVPYVDVMLRAGHLTHEDLNEERPKKPDVASLSNEELRDEVYRRMKGRKPLRSAPDEEPAPARKTRKGGGQAKREDILP